MKIQTGVLFALGVVFAVNWIVFLIVGKAAPEMGGYGYETNAPYFYLKYNLAQYAYGPIMQNVANVSTRVGYSFNITTVPVTNTNDNYKVTVTNVGLGLLVACTVFYWAGALFSTLSKWPEFVAGENLSGLTPTMVLLFGQALAWAFIQSDLVYTMGEESAVTSIVVCAVAVLYAFGLFLVETEKGIAKATNAGIEKTKFVYVFAIAVVFYTWSALIASLYRPYAIRSYTIANANTPPLLTGVLAMHTVNLSWELFVFCVTIMINTGLILKVTKEREFWVDFMTGSSHVLFVTNVLVYVWGFSVVFAQAGDLAD